MIWVITCPNCGAEIEEKYIFNCPKCKTNNIKSRILSSSTN